jgi:tetratricopeptide (TPR) repeat protein
MLVVETIDNIEDFKRLQGAWDAAYDADPEAQYFLSWTWLSKWLPRLVGPWFILAAREANSQNYAGFFPLRLRTKEWKSGGFYNEINMAGNYVADYTGFVCKPEVETDVIKAFAARLKQLNWANVHLENIRTSETRLQRLLNHFPGTLFERKEFVRVNKKDNTDNCVCPILHLPDSWEKYLENLPSSNMRQKIRRFLRQLESSDELRITVADANTVERDVELLLSLWETKWTQRKGDRIKILVENNRNMLRDAADTGSLFLPVLWQGEKPLGALGSFIDPVKRSLLFFVAGRDETVTTPPPGVILHAYSIRHAIGEGLVTYDFLRGNEPYKYTWGAIDRSIKCIDLVTRDRKNLGGKIDSRSIPMLMREAAELCKTSKLVEAALVFRQVLDADPQCANALYGLGQIRAAQGKHGAARRLFKALVAVEPNAERAWLRLGKSLEAHRRFADAADAYREAIGARPGNAEAHSKLGNVLYKLQKFDEAIAAYDEALRLRPAFLEAEVSRANILHALARLPAAEWDNCAELNARLGDAIRAKGHNDFAASCYRQAIRLKPDFTSAHRSLAGIMLAKGDVGSAIASLNKILELDPDDADAGALRAKLTQGDGALRQTVSAPVRADQAGFALRD